VIKGRNRTAEPEPGFALLLQELLVGSNCLSPDTIRDTTDTGRDTLDDFLADIGYPGVPGLPCSESTGIPYNGIPPASCTPPWFNHDRIFSAGCKVGNRDIESFKKMLGIQFIEKTPDGIF
jgi:hypothetical protein